jgi:hypothetical protein
VLVVMSLEDRSGGGGVEIRPLIPHRRKTGVCINQTCLFEF